MRRFWLFAALTLASGCGGTPEATPAQVVPQAATSARSELDGPEYQALADALAKALQGGPALWPGFGSFTLQHRRGGEETPPHDLVVFHPSAELRARVGAKPPREPIEGDASWFASVDAATAAAVVEAVGSLPAGGRTLVRPLGLFSAFGREGSVVLVSLNAAPSFVRTLNPDPAAADAALVLSASAALKNDQTGIYPEWEDGAYAQRAPNGAVVPAARP